jgi:hypothetical protein
MKPDLHCLLAGVPILEFCLDLLFWQDTPLFSLGVFSCMVPELLINLAIVLLLRLSCLAPAFLCAVLSGY